MNIIINYLLIINQMNYRFDDQYFMNRFMFITLHLDLQICLMNLRFLILGLLRIFLHGNHLYCKLDYLEFLSAISSIDCSRDGDLR